MAASAYRAMTTATPYITVFYNSKDWAAEAVDYESGDCFRVIFTGPMASDRAQEYVDWKNNQNARSVNA